MFLIITEEFDNFGSAYDWLRDRQERRLATPRCQIKTNAPQNGAFLPLLSNLAEEMVPSPNYPGR